MNYLRVKNWEEHQHYKDRCPPWIKLHRSVLDDYDFSQLPDSAKGQLMLLWLFASQHDGRIPNDPKFLRNKLSLQELPDLDFFVNQGFLVAEQDDSEPLADCKHDASTPQAKCSPRREEERREEKPIVRFLDESKKIIDHLNGKTGCRFRHVPANLDLVRARLEEGFTVDDCLAVIDAKSAEWNGNADMEKYLRPETLFARKKFASYSGQVGSVQIAGTDL